MKTLVLMGLLGLSSALTAQNKEEAAITKTIEKFSKAGDDNNTKALAVTLDENYRIVMNRLFGSEIATVMNKTEYLAKIESKEYGGDKRQVEVKSILINGTTASVNVLFKGEKMTFNSIMIMVKDKNDDWKLISDTPMIQ